MLKKLALLAAASAALSLACHASLSPFMAYHRGPERSNANNVVGTRFTAAADASITHLGFYDAHGDGLLSSHRVALFDLATGQASATATIPAGNETLYSYACRWVKLDTPVSIEAGKTYLIAAEVFAGGDPFLNSDPNALATVFAPYVSGDAIPAWGPLGSEISQPPNLLGSSHYHRSYLAGNFATTVETSAQTISVQPEQRYQTIESIGSSTGWNMEWLGKHWPESTREEIAKLLYSKDMDENGNPLGVGFSLIRFYIGAGTFEQGEASQIVDPNRRTEGYLNDDGTYDWSKQAGVQWFLRKAWDYGVEKKTAFSVSPPVQMTKNGLGHLSEGQTRVTNLKEDAYDEFANFLSTVMKHYQDEGLPFDYLSPLNEPNYNWNGNTQEGSYWSQENAARVTQELDLAFNRDGVSTQIILDEAPQYDYALTGSHGNPGNLPALFSPDSPSYVGNLSKVAPQFAAHSYWTYNNNQQLIELREAIREQTEALGLSFRQTEYSLLGIDKITEDTPDSYTDIALFHAKVLQADLVAANAVSWAFWSTVGPERYGHKNRFALIRIEPPEGELDLRIPGTYAAHKSLWTLGNFSRFVRPGYRRIELGNADDPSGLFGSAFLSPDERKLVVVMMNMSYQEKPTRIDLSDTAFAKAKVYLTDRERDLRFLGQVSATEQIALPPRSISTFVYDASPWAQWVETYLGDQAAENQSYDADPDRDQASNLFEYATGTHPLLPDNASRVYSVQRNPTWSLQLNPEASDLILEIFTSSDLENWSASGHRLYRGEQTWSIESDSLSIVEQITGENSDIVTLELNPDQQKFYRLSVSPVE
ncbi:DUF4082 domain-containing protein [Pelagicoccus sp. NFK12]|uniref:DUF4082 domain-containing protein n=1 Tax=Pelagicoccus enzymogenes TaxID=2773457 RepID=A0A927F4V9_9BACT|nr:glycoside hydrolase [Pelagicoccus enzymogenes]MBD5777934.1 DUF4082 domain-containing protein [Pelagicoccus enzymogenes]